MFADRVQDTTTSTGTGTITLAGSPPAGRQAFASEFAVGDLVCYCISAQGSGTEWEVGIGVLATSTTLTRSAGNVIDSSAGAGTLVSFSAGTKDVFCTMSGVILRRNTPIPVAWATAWDTAGYKIMPVFTLTGALALTSTDTNSVEGGSTQAYIIANGTNIPTVDGVALSNWTNTNGVVHLVTLIRSGTYKAWTSAPMQAAAVVQVATAPSWTTAPVLASAAVGAAASVSTSGLSAGYPSATLTYQWKLGGTNISGATSATYTPQAGDAGGTLTCTVTGTNASGAATSTSNGVTVLAVPGAPTGVTAGTIAATSVPLSWTAPASNGGSAITGYKIGYRTPQGSGSYTYGASSGSTSTSGTLSGLTASTAYDIVVRAVNANGDGIDSTAIQVTTTAASSFPRMDTEIGEVAAIVESGTGPYTYTHTQQGDNFNRADLPHSTLKFPGNTAATASFLIGTRPPVNNGGLTISLSTNNTQDATNTPNVGWGTQSTAAISLVSAGQSGSIGMAGPGATSITQQNVNDAHNYYRISRATNGGITVQSSADGTTWVERIASAISSTAANDLFLKISFTSPGGATSHVRSVQILAATGMSANS